MQVLAIPYSFLAAFPGTGAILCMNATIDPDLVKMVQQDVNALKNDVDKLTFEQEVNRENVKKALQDAVRDLEELHDRVTLVDHEQEVIKQNQRTLCDKVSTTQGQISELRSEQEDVQRRVTFLEDQQNSCEPEINYGNSPPVFAAIILSSYKKNSQLHMAICLELIDFYKQ